MCVCVCVCVGGGVVGGVGGGTNCINIVVLANWHRFCLAPITSLRSLCFQIGGVLSNWETGRNHTEPALSQLDELRPIGPRVQFYRSWCKLTGYLDRPKLFPIGPRTPPKAGPGAAVPRIPNLPTPLFSLTQLGF